MYILYYVAYVSCTHAAPRITMSGNNARAKLHINTRINVRRLYIIRGYRVNSDVQQTRSDFGRTRGYTHKCIQGVCVCRRKRRLTAYVFSVTFFRFEPVLFPSKTRPTVSGAPTCPAFDSAAEEASS